MPSEQIRKRLENQATLLRYLRRVSTSTRTALSRDCSIRKSSVTNICKDLLSQGALYELEPGYVRSEVGLAAEHWGALAVRLEAGSVAVAIVDHQGKTYGIWRNPFDRSTKPSAMVKIMAGVVAEALEGAAASSFPRLAGIGVSVPGMVNPNKGVCLSAVNLDHWENVPVGQMLVEWLPDGAPGIVIENDAVAALLANRWFLEGGTSVDDVLYFSVGEGVGCAQLAGGHINRGRNFAAGEIGCLPAGKEGRPCRCGKVDCLQVYCSEAGVAETLAMGEEVASYCEDIDATKEHALTKALSPLVREIHSMVALADPEEVLLGSRVGALTNAAVSTVRRSLEERMGPGTVLPVIRSALPLDDASLRGAAVAVFQKAFETEDLAI